MSIMSWLRKTVLVGVGCAVVVPLLLTVGGVSTAQDKKDNAPKAAKSEFTYRGAGTCILCHATGPAGVYNQDFVLLTEYTTWRLYDRHSQAYLVLEGPRAKRMGELLKTDVTRDAACLNCHAMKYAEASAGTGFSIRDGVSCDGCHGPSSAWFEKHTDFSWRSKTVEEKEKLGMANLRDPNVRAELCMSCHVGNAAEGKVVSHDMYAAGHPPLPNFETALFSYHEPQHWRNKRDVPFFLKEASKDEKLKKIYELASSNSQESQLVVSSSLKGLEAIAKLVENRSNIEDGKDLKQRYPELTYNQGSDPKQLWPQLALAQSDCYACHHELQRGIKNRDGSYTSWRQLRGYPGKPGRPQIRPWPAALAQLGGVGIGPDAGLAKALGDLSAACDEQPFGIPAKLVTAGEGLKKLVEMQLKAANVPSTSFDGIKLLKGLCALGATGDYPDYESAREIASGITVIYSELERKPANDKAIEEEMKALKEEFELHPSPVRRERVVLLLKTLGVDPKQMDAQILDEVDKLTDKGFDKSPMQKQAKELYNVIKDKAAMLDDAKLAQTAPKFLSELQDLNDKELTAYLLSISKYDPTVFKARLAKLGKLLE